MAEVRRYLSRRGCAPDAADAAVDKLHSLHYLNDETFALNWAIGRAQGRGYGPVRIEQELRSKGIEHRTIRDALRDAFGQVDETERAKILLTRHFKGRDLTDPKTLRRAAAFLQRRGYGSKVVFNLLRYSTEDD